MLPTHRRPRRARSARLLLAALLCFCGEASAQAVQALVPKLEGAALVEALAGGGHVILLRHAGTLPEAPAEEIDLSNCDTQRNLSDEGRAQAKAMGEAFRKLGIRVSEVLSSPWCRCIETAKLAFGKATVSDLLAQKDELGYAEKQEWAARIRRQLATPPEPAGTNTVLVTHTGTLLYSFGLQARPEGIAHVFRRGPAGTADYVGMIQIADWPTLAGQ